MEIKVLGSGCANCKKLHHMVEVALKDLQITANLEYVTDMMEIAKSGLLRTPGLILNGKIISSGRIPSMVEIQNWIKEAN